MKNDKLESAILIAEQEVLELAQTHDKQYSNCVIDSLLRLQWSKSHNEFHHHLYNCICWIFNGIDKNIVEIENEVKRIIELIDASERIDKNEATYEDIDTMTDHFIGFMYI